MTADFITNIICEKLDTLCWTDVVAKGISFLVEDVVCDKEGKVISKNIYPVTCNTTYSECGDGRFTPLEPNLNYKSLLWMEQSGDQTSGISYHPKFPNNKKYIGKKHTGNLWLSAWLNPTEFGGDSCDIKVHILPELNNILCCSGTLDKVTYSFSVTRTHSKEFTKKQVFGRFGYSKLPDCKKYFYHPYDYFSLTIGYEMFITDLCAPDLMSGLECGDPLPCRFI